MDGIDGNVLGLAVAAGLGLLIGVEREQHKATTEPHAPAGVRTFTLLALAGALGQLLGPVALALTILFVGAGAVASFALSHARDPGLTTESAMVVTTLLGALALPQPGLAAGLGVIVAVVLASKDWLHRFARQVLSERELADGLLLAAAALVVLPLLPNRTVDPWNVINPRQLGGLVVLVMAINGAGYVAMRSFGVRHGLALAGFVGGFVSSAATIGSMGSRARSQPELLSACVTGALLSNVATVLQLSIVLAAFSTSLLLALTPGLIGAGVAAASYAALLGWRGIRGGGGTPSDPPRGRAFRLSHAVAFAAAIGTMLVIAALVQRRFGDAGVMVAGAIGGFADVHAAAGSVAQLTSGGTLALGSATHVVLVAFVANTGAKALMAFLGGGRDYGLRILPGLLLIAAALIAGVRIG